MTADEAGTAPTTVVLHPGGIGRGVREQLEMLPGVRLVAPRSPAGVLRALQTATVLVTSRPDWCDEYLKPRLRWVQSQSAGHEGFPLEEFRRRGIVFTTASGLHSVCAEHAIGLLITLLRDIHLAVRDMSDRRWSPHVAEELAGRTVVIVGLGAIGEAIARRLEAWDVRLVGVTRSPDRYTGVVADVRGLSELSTACAGASVLVLAIPSTPETRHLVTGSVLDALGQGWLVNVSRGSVVDEAALVERLSDGRLRGAGLDVLEQEPPSATAAVWSLPNVICTPHMAGQSPRYGERFKQLMARNLSALHEEGEWLNRIC